MTLRSDLKKLVRDRQAKTGESYTAARVHVVRERDRRLALEGRSPPGAATVECVVLKCNLRSVRVRVLEESGELTVRATDCWKMIPGMIATLRLTRRWRFRDEAHASGTLRKQRLDVPTLGLSRLPLEDLGREDLRRDHEPFRRPDPYAPLWREFTARPRPVYEMHEITWGVLDPPEGDEEGENLTCDAAELREQGDDAGARKLLMQALHRDLRCLDAHAHLGNLAFTHDLEAARQHYEVGVQIGDSFLASIADTDAALPWGLIYNRPFLRCLHGLGLCLWRLERYEEAEQVFLRNLFLSPNDEQGVRFLLREVQGKQSWQELEEAPPQATRSASP